MKSAISQSVLALVGDKREVQDAQWGGPEHDDKHTKLEWMDFISKQVEKFAVNLINRGDAYMDTPDAKDRFVNIAALAIAALESFERKVTDIE